jgi:3(or 17)beta-hydroxysteroid dehydrogenase
MDTIDARCFDGRTALVTGAASGIGRATAAMLAARGATVVFADVDAAGGRAAAGAAGGTARFASLDVASEDDWVRLVDELVATHGRIDHLVNSAGINPMGSIVDTDYADWRRTFAVNVDGMFLGCKHALRAMLAAGNRGSIVNVASPQAYRTAPVLVAYGASKAAAVNLTHSVALFAAPHGIRCNAVLPGAVRTEMTERFLRALPDYDEGVRQVAAMHPLNRMCEADEVAKAILYLLGDDAGFVTGTELAVDGGYLAA